MNSVQERLEVALELSMMLGQLVERSNQSDDVAHQARLQESIEWTREQLREARRRIVDSA